MVSQYRKAGNRTVCGVPSSKIADNGRRDPPTWTDGLEKIPLRVWICPVPRFRNFVSIRACQEPRGMPLHCRACKAGHDVEYGFMNRVGCHNEPRPWSLLEPRALLCTDWGSGSLAHWKRGAVEAWVAATNALRARFSGTRPRLDVAAPIVGYTIREMTATKVTTVYRNVRCAVL